MSPTSLPIARRRLPTVAVMPIVAVVAIAILAGLAVFITTRGGIGLTNDSQAYLRLAAQMRGGAAGAPTTEPMSRRFPPGLPALLVAGGAALRVSPERAARLLNVACAVASTLLIAAIVRRATRGRPGPAVVAAALFATSIGTLSTHLFLWSEPAFTACWLASVLTLDAFLRSGRSRWLLATAALAAAAIWLRYAAAALVLAQCLTVLFRAPRDAWWRRLRDAGALGVAPTLALAAWLGTAPAHGDVGERHVAFAPIATRRLEQCARTIGGWIFAGYDGRPLAYPIAAAALAVLAWGIARAIRTRNATLALPWIFACAYPPFLVVSISLFDPDTPLDPRILAPLHACAILLACSTLVPTSRRGIAIAGTVASILVGLQAYGATTYLIATRANGMGYAGARWQESETLRFVATLPPGARLFTTHQTAVRMIAGRTVDDLPSHDAKSPPAADKLDVRRQMNQMLKAIDAAGRRGYVVYVKRPVSKGKAFVKPAELARYFRVERVAQAKDGAVYQIESRTRPPGSRYRATTTTTSTRPPVP